MTNERPLLERLRQMEGEGYMFAKLCREEIERLRGEVKMLRLRLDTRELNDLVQQHCSDEPGAVAMRPPPGTKALSDMEHAWVYDATRHDPKLYSLIRRLVQYGVEQDPPCMFDGPAVKSEGSLRTPQGEPALTQTDGLPGTREPVSQQPHGIAGESPALFEQCPRFNGDPYEPDRCIYCGQLKEAHELRTNV